MGRVRERRFRPRQARPALHDAHDSDRAFFQLDRLFVAACGPRLREGGLQNGPSGDVRGTHEQGAVFARAGEEAPAVRQPTRRTIEEIPRCPMHDVSSLHRRDSPDLNVFVPLRARDEEPRLLGLFVGGQ